MCEDVNPFWDQILDLVDERKKTYDPDDRMYLDNVKIHLALNEPRAIYSGIKLLDSLFASK